MLDRTEIEGIKALLQGDVLSHKIAGEILRNYTPEEIWNILMEDSDDFSSIINYTSLSKILDYQNIKFTGSIQRLNEMIYIFDISTERYETPSEEFKQHIIKILTEESV